MNKILSSEIRIEKIKAEHNVTSFRSKETDLQNFLQEDALYNQEQNISVTFLWFYKEEIISYISLLTDRISLKTNLKEHFQQKRVNYNTLPALKIGRLCVDDRFLRRGIGTYMIKAAYQKARNINEHTAGCRFLTVDSKNDSVPFYAKFGFQVLKKGLKTTDMFFDIKLNQQN